MPINPALLAEVTTDCFWSINDIPLQTMAYNIVSLGGQRMGVPPLRGADILVPYRPGQVHLPRIPDSRTITLGMWVLGADGYGNPPPPGTSLRHQFNSNWRKLRNLMWNPDSELTLTKRFEDDNGVIVECSAKGQFAGGLEPTMNGPYRGAFTVDIHLADPFFYGTEVSVSFPGGPTVTKSVDVIGDYTTFAINLHMPNTSSRFTNNTHGVWCGVSSPAEVNVLNYTVSMPIILGSPPVDPVLGRASRIGALTHGGANQWFLLTPGTNSITVTNAYAAYLTYRPVYV